MEKVSVIVPCYNEEEGIPGLISSLKHLARIIPEEKYSLEYIFVDDGSADNTNKLLKASLSGLAGARLLTHETNLGYGNALKTGFKASTGNFIVCYDGDFTTPVDDIPPMLGLIKAEVDIVSGSAFHAEGNAGKVLWYRLVLSKTLIAIYKLVLGKKAHNITSFTLSFRVYRKKVIDTIKFRSGDFLAASEILILAILKGFRVVEFPTTLVDREYGKSKMKVIRTIFAHLKFIFRILPGRGKEQ